MKIVQLNYGIHGSTGNIMVSLAKQARECGHEVYTFSGTQKGVVPEFHQIIGSREEQLVNRIVAVFLGISEKGTLKGTQKLIGEIKKIKPDIIHLHNLHGWYLNIPELLNYIKIDNIRVIWTLHDCWGFTAQCSHFSVEKCEKWKKGCYQCPRYRMYPYTFIDRTKTMWKLKKEWFTGVPNMTIVTPSQWLADLVKESFLKNYPVKVIPNGIDLTVFKPTPSDFRKKYHCEDKRILLGVAFGWGKRKGLDVFIELAKRLGEEYQIVLVGTDDDIDKQLPENIISIHRTNNQQELAEIYTAADLFVNPTREENYPTVNMEAIACGTPVLTFRTGGSPESVDEKTGCVVDCDDVDAMEREIVKICTEKIFSGAECVGKSSEFDMNKRFEEYIKLYESN